MRRTTISAALAFAALAVAGPAAAQQATLTPAQGGRDIDRNEIIQFLGRQDVNRVARTIRFDTRKAADRVDEMTPMERYRVATKVREFERAAPPADAVVISTTTIIIALLVLILLILVL